MRRRLGPVMALAVALASGAALAGEAPEAHGAPSAEGAGAHGEHESHHINWAEGFLGEKDDVPPGLLYRPKGTPPPFLASVINAALLFTILVVAGRKPVAEALQKRKARIVAGMEEAGKMKAGAAERLAGYERKLERLDEEIERVRREMRESAEAERRRILAEAKERRDRMERDAKLLVEQELKAAREALMRETVAGALRSAEDLLAKQLGAADQDRLAREYLDTLKAAPIQSRGGVS